MFICHTLTIQPLGCYTEINACLYMFECNWPHILKLATLMSPPLVNKSATALCSFTTVNVSKEVLPLSTISLVD